jgi:hypothetical protein
VTVRQPVRVAAPRRARANAASAAKAAPAATATAAAKGPAVKKAGAAKKAPAGKKTRPAKPGKSGAAHTGAKKERAYGVMPGDFVNTFGKTTVADLAEVYQVPRHTIQAWADTARKQGKIPPARSRSRA